MAMYCDRLLSARGGSGAQLSQITLPQQQHGFSLVELLWALLALAVLTVLAMPLYHTHFSDQSVEHVRDRFVLALQKTRHDAIDQGKNMSLCPSRDGLSCGESADWQYGWLVYLGHQSIPGKVIPEQLLIEKELLTIPDLSFKVVDEKNEPLRLIGFDTRGFNREQNAVLIKLCTKKRGSSEGVRLLVEQTGIVRKDLPEKYSAIRITEC